MTFQKLSLTCIISGCLKTIWVTFRWIRTFSSILGFPTSCLYWDQSELKLVLFVSPCLLSPCVSLDTFGTGCQRARISPRSQSLWRILFLKAQLLEEILKKLRYVKNEPFICMKQFWTKSLANQIMIYIYICILYTQMNFSICTYVFLTKSLLSKLSSVLFDFRQILVLELSLSRQMRWRHVFQISLTCKGPVHFLEAFVSNIRIKSLEVMFCTNESHTICWISR